MDASLAFTAFFMGLAGGPHCLAMCGPVCAALLAPASVPGEQPVRFQGAGALAPAVRLRSGSAGPAIFLLARLLSYTTLGMVAAASMQTVGWLSVQSAALRPVWTFVHVGAAVIGGFLLWQARQPPWLEGAGRWLWLRVRGIARQRGDHGGLASAAAPLTLGLVWAFLPCGLLYAALLVAALSPGLWQGGLVMALFALGSSLSLWAGPWLWRRLSPQGGSRWAMRLAGALLLATSLWALWLALAHERAPWCVTPA
ncbi:MAG: sulfite exporter TauE/SafE family protein [Betaproteobacteria bacterium]